MVPKEMDTLIPFPLPADTDNPAQTHELITRRAEELDPETSEAIASVAFSTFAGGEPVTVSEMSGVERAAPAPVAVPTCATET